MVEFFYRTEDIRSDEVINYFVETREDRRIVESLKGRNPAILEGSRGVGKSFLFRVAEAELLNDFEEQRVFPVYVTFNRSSLISTPDATRFQHWMIARICSRVVRSLQQRGLVSSGLERLSILTSGQSEEKGLTAMEQVAEAFESSWQRPGENVDVGIVPTVEEVKDAIEDFCRDRGLARLEIFIDEAAHVFIPEQQRQFFTLFRDLRSPYITCKAAVYPGVTAYGETFQPAHDATMVTLDRDVLASNYVSTMRQIVAKQAQADSTMLRSITTNGENFAILAYASNGNPRTLLKTLTRAPRVNRQQVNEVIREYYRTDVWSEHSLLGEKYPGHQRLIDWGREFVEDLVLPELQKKNQQYLESDRNTTCFFWIHRNAPQAVKEALRLLAYTGIVKEHGTGIKATRAEVGTRYMVNLGTLFALEPVPTATAFEIAKQLTPKRMSEYGANHPAYQDLTNEVSDFAEPDMAEVLRRELEKPIDALDITDWQKGQLRSMNLHCVRDVIQATETKLQQAYYVGEVRARRMRNAAEAAVYEYLSG